MDHDKTTPNDDETRQYYRCPCGSQVALDMTTGGNCGQCQRHIPASVTRYSLSVTINHVEGEDAISTLPELPKRGGKLIGKRLGHFEMQELVGQGGMGEVYRALDTSLQRYVAVKVLKGSSIKGIGASQTQSLMHEAIAQARVNHPNIVSIYYVSQEDDILFLAMELVDGGSVAEQIETGPLPYGELCRSAIKVISALKIAWQHGIVHSDIKPKNLLLVRDGEIKLSDFGMARLPEDDGKSTFGGTPNYLAPELLAGEHPSIQSDMYALGVTLYEMTFCRLPIQLSGDTPDEWKQVHAESIIKFPDVWPDHLPEGWKDVLLTLLAPKPEQRFPTYDALQNSLAAIAPEDLTNARPAPRIIAFWIDSLCISLIFLPLWFGLDTALSLLHIGFSVAPEMALFLALGIYTSTVSTWRQSLGRELLHIKVVNQFGLQPTRKKMILRSVLRFLPHWGVAASTLLGQTTWAIAIILTGSILYFLINGFLMLFGGAGSSLSDRIVKTRVVAGTDR